MVTELCFQPHETIYRGLRAPDLDVLVCVLSVPVGRFYARARVCRLGLCVDIGVVSVCMCVCVCVCWYPCIQASEVHCSSEEGCVCVCVCVLEVRVSLDARKRVRVCVCVCVSAGQRHVQTVLCMCVNLEILVCSYLHSGFTMQVTMCHIDCVLGPHPRGTGR